MSDPKAPADSSQERGDRIESNLKKELSEKEDKICLKSNLDGNNKEEFPSSTLENDLDEAPDENLTEFVSSDTEIMNPEVESGDTDDNIETKHSWGDMDDSSMDSLTNQDLDAIKISSSDELKKTGLSFLEPGVSLAGDDFDSENQDDDLVLKWDDDDEEDGADLAIEGDQIDSDNVNNDGPTEEIDFDIVTAEDDESTMKPDSLADPIDSIHSQPEDAAESTEKSKYDTSDDTTNRVDTNNRITLAPVENLESHNNVTMETANATAKNIDSEAIIDAISDIKDPENDKEENNETIEPTASSELEDKEIMEVDETSKSLNSNGDKNIIEADKSDEKIDDSEENDELLSEIDAQIAELDASLSKSENEKKPTESSDVNTEKCDSLDHEVETVVNENININETEIMQKGKEASAGATDEKIVFQKTILSLESKIPELPESKINEKCSLSETRTHIENGNPDGLSKADSNQTFINTDIHTVTDKLNRTIEESCNVQVSDKTTAEDTKIDASVNEDSAVITESLANSTAILDNSTVNANIDSATAVNNDSFSPNTSVIEPAKHGLNEPNMMLEIPTQELIEFDESLNLTDDEKNTRVDTQQNIDSKSMQHESMSLDIVDQISQKDGNIRENIQDNLKRTDKPSNVDIETIIILPAMSIKDDVENSKQTGQGDEKQSLESETKTTEEPAVSLKKSIEQPKDIGQDVKKDSIEEVMLEEISKDNDLEKTGLENSASVESATPSVVEKTTLLQDVTPSDSIEQSKDTDDKEDGKIGIDSQTTEAIQPSTTKDVPQSTSAQKQMAPDSSDDDTEVTDSLGLLAECSRVAEDDDDQEISDREDDDDDFDGSPDESSNQPDQSEDSVQNSETDLPKLTASTSGPLDKDNDNAQGFEKTLHLTPELFDSLLANKEKLEDEPSALPEEVPDDGDMDVDDDIVCEEVVVAPNAKVVAPTTLIGDADPDVDEALDATLGEPDIDAVPDVDGDPDIGAGTDTADVPVIEGVESIDIDKHTEKMKTPTEQETQLEVPLVKESTLDDTEETSQSQLRTLLEHGSAETTTEKDSKVTAAAAVTSKDKAGEGAIVDLGEISSEEDVPEVKKDQNIDADVIKPTTTTKVTSRINTSEISIKTTISPKPPMVIPEVAKIKEPQTPVKAKYPLEVFNLDSDDEETPAAVPAEPGKPTDKCINNLCQSDASATYVPADSSSRMYYQCKKRGYICLPCLEPVHNTTEKLVAGIKNFTPLLELEVRERDLECVEILDSDSEDETDSVPHGDREKIQEPAILERQLSAIINETWDKYQFERLLTDAQDQLFKEMDRIQMENKEINALLDECQTATDKLRDELYSTFSVPVEEQPPITIYDMPDKQFTCLETQSEVIKDVSNKRRLSDATESKAKRPSMTAEGDNNTESPKSTEGNKQDDDKDVSVVRLSAEAAPPSLPPIGEPVRPPLTPALSVYAMRHAFGSWIKARILEVTPKGQSPLSLNFTMCRVKFENKTNRNATKVLPARCLAYCEPSHVRMTIGTRVIALFKALSPDEKEPRRESYYSGVIAEIPNPVNKYRYLVFFDDGYAQYVSHADTRLVCEFSPLVWEEVHSFSREFVKEYLLAYPERPMVRLHTGQHLKTEWNGKWWASRVIAVDASLVQVYFEQDKRTEWIYRGSTRLAPLYLELQAAEKHSRARPLPRNRQNKLNMPYVEYTRTDEAETEKQVSPEADKIASFKAQHEAEIRRQRAVAKKSTTGVGHIPPPVPTPADTVTSRVVYYTPKNAIKPHKMVPHNCGPRCKRTDVLSLKELRTYNPLAKPLLSGWERQTARFKGHKEVAYRAPCGRRIRNMAELHRYLRLIDSDMGVDLFDFGPNTHCLAEFVLNKCIVGKKDLSHGKENVPVPCVNYYDDSLPEFCSYNTERTPTAGVPLNTDPDFLCGCDCTDDCEDKSKCACWKLTLEGARTIGLDGNVGYEYKRLPEPLPSGIYECNARCKCKSTCLNRVAQHPLQLKLQVFKTANRGWGIRALNDVPKGSFLCIYAGNLLTDATANLDGLNEGDEYLAELDYIEVVEQMKEGFEEDIPDADKQLDKKESAQQSDQESESTESEEEAGHSKSDDADGDFQPAYMPGVVAEFSKRLRKRDKKKKKKEEVKKEKEREKEKEKENKENADEDCITISDDEEIREPSRFAAQAGMGGEYVSKYRSVRTYFGKDEACYIMDAKVQGNIGRYLNHSCSPNVFVQNVFVDTHDPRFPWVAFFALSHIRAGTELTWNYNYDVGSVPGKALYCYCGAPNCRGRLL